jgi:23S rRNA (adenine2503-C2)-methyltransferase
MTQLSVISSFDSHQSTHTKPSTSSLIPKSKKNLVDLRALTFTQLQQYLTQWQVSSTHAGRIFRGIHRLHQGLLQIPNLGRHAHTISQYAQIAPIQLITHNRSSDGTVKLLFALADGARIEAVLLPMRKERYTLCLSTQVGCAMACTFCATGTMGFTRHLTAGEIVAQVYQAAQWIQQDQSMSMSAIPIHTQQQVKYHQSSKSQQSPVYRRLSHLVFMGMGEPLHAYDSTRDALSILLDQRGICLRARHITVSTVGLVPAMRKFAQDFQGKVQLALSLHAGRDETRCKIIPVAKKWTLAQLKQQLVQHPLPGSRVLMLEYVVLPGINDSLIELQAVAEFCNGLRAIVNLIPFNPFTHAPFRAPTTAEVEAVDQILKSLGVACSIRVTRGQEQASACGQLALQNAPA